MASVKIRSAFSAQGTNARANPFVEKTIVYIEDHSHGEARQLTCADQGCGKLRHLRLLLKRFRRIVLIDTLDQLNRDQRIGGTPRTSIREYVDKLELDDKRIAIVSSEDFEQSRLGIDVIFNVCVLDVEVPGVRKRILRAAYRNLKIGGLLVLIVPRNDQTITVRCARANRFLDGHFFHHHGAFTFYRNFRNTTTLVRLLKRAGFAVLDDLSVYRQVCLICRK